MAASRSSSDREPCDTGPVRQMSCRPFRAHQGSTMLLTVLRPQRRLLPSAACFFLLMTPHLAFAGAGDVVACKKITDEHARLACFDQTSADLEKDMAASSEGLFGFLGLGATKETDF